MHHKHAYRDTHTEISKKIWNFCVFFSFGDKTETVTQFYQRQNYIEIFNRIEHQSMRSKEALHFTLIKIFRDALVQNERKIHQEISKSRISLLSRGQRDKCEILCHKCLMHGLQMCFAK